MEKKTLFALTILISVLFSSCGLGLVKFTVNSDGSVTDPEGISYRYCSVSVSPIKAGDKYGRASGGYNLYAVDGLEPSKWLCEGEVAISLVYAEVSLERPDLSSFEPEGAVISQTPVETRMEIGVIENTEIISQIADMMENDGDAPLPSSVSQVYDVSFTSSKYPGLYYTVQYITADDGRTYFRDRGAERCIYANDLLSIEQDESEA